mgnify:CR=1 FL=1
MKKAQIKKSVSALAMAAVIAVSLFGYGCGAKSASTSSDAGVSGDFTGTAKGFGGDVSVTLTLTDGAITGCTAEGKDETEGVGSQAIARCPARSRERQHRRGRRVRRYHHLYRHQGGCGSCPDRCRPEPR